MNRFMKIKAPVRKLQALYFFFFNLLKIARYRVFKLSSEAW